MSHPDTCVREFVQRGLVPRGHIRRPHTTGRYSSHLKFTVIVKTVTEPLPSVALQLSRMRWAGRVSKSRTLALFTWTYLDREMARDVEGTECNAFTSSDEGGGGEGAYS